MTQVAFPGVGMEFPYNLGDNQVNTVLSTVFTLNSTGSQSTLIGQLCMEGSPASSSAKTMSTGSIAIVFGTVTFNSSTVVRIGLQNINLANGPAIHPSGTSNVFRDVNTTETINTNSTRVFQMNSGSMSLVNGQHIAVAVEMLTKASTSTFQTRGVTNYTAALHSPVCRNRPVSTVTWNAPTIVIPSVNLVFDDGTNAIIANALPTASISTEAWTTTTNPNERGMLFQVPQDVKINGMWLNGLVTASTTLFDLTVYSDPLGTPTAILTDQILTKMGAPGVARKLLYGPVDMVSLSRNTNYVIAVKAQSTTIFELDSISLSNISTKVFFGSSTLMKVTRNGATAFVIDATSSNIYKIGVNIASWDDGTGSGAAGGAGMLYIPNMDGT